MSLMWKGWLVWGHSWALVWFCLCSTMSDQLSSSGRIFPTAFGSFARCTRLSLCSTVPQQCWAFQYDARGLASPCHVPCLSIRVISMNLLVSAPLDSVCRSTSVSCRFRLSLPGEHASQCTVLLCQQTFLFAVSTVWSGLQPCLGADRATCSELQCPAPFFYPVPCSL